MPRERDGEAAGCGRERGGGDRAENIRIRGGPFAADHEDAVVDGEAGEQDQRDFGGEVERLAADRVHGADGEERHRHRDHRAEAVADAAEEDKSDHEDRKHGQDHGEGGGVFHVGHDHVGDLRAGDGDPVRRMDMKFCEGRLRQEDRRIPAVAVRRRAQDAVQDGREDVGNGVKIGRFESAFERSEERIEGVRLEAFFFGCGAELFRELGVIEVFAPESKMDLPNGFRRDQKRRG